MHGFRQKKTRLLLGAACAVALIGCSTSPKNYKLEGEKFLESDDLAESAGYKYRFALCDQPQTIEVGTQYACSATDNDDNSWEFIIEITGDRELTVVSGRVVK